jgi:hypothetical protein
VEPVLRFLGLFRLSFRVVGGGAASFRGDFGPGGWNQLLRGRGRHCCEVLWGDWKEGGARAPG